MFYYISIVEKHKRKRGNYFPKQLPVYRNFKKSPSVFCMDLISY